MTTTQAVTTIVFPAYASDTGMAGEHRVECVVPDYLADLTPAQVLTVLERHARRCRPDGHDLTPAGGALLRALGRYGDGYPTGRDVTPEARDRALSAAVRDLHAACAPATSRYAPAGRCGTHAEYVAHLLATAY